jgi:PAS domain S-box-containing protein
VLPDDLIPRRDPFLPYVAREKGLFTITNLAHDLRFSQDECVAGPWALRSYAGLALRTASGKLIGTLAVYDTVARELSPSQTEGLILVAQQAAAWIELRAPARDRVAGAAALVESNTIDEAPIGIAYADRAGRFLRCNRAFSSLLGFTPEELENRSILALTHSEDVALTSAELERLWRREVPFVDLEKRFCCKDGSALWVRVTKSLVPPTGDAPECQVEFIRDISTRKRLSLELEEHKALLETLIANLPLALIACDADGHVTHYNREAAEMCSMPQDESAPEASTDYPVAAAIYHADGVTPVDRADRPLARTLRGEMVQNLELVMVPRGSAPRVTLSTGRRLAGPDGQPMGAVVVTQDITERRRAELELERLHTQLRSSARLAGMAEVATSVLHNVGNVLNSINVSATLLADRVRRSKAPDLCRVAELLQSQGEKLGEFMSADERGKQVPGYLQALGEQLVKDGHVVLEHVASLQENLEHVKNAVTMQQNYARLTSLRETVSVADLVEDSVRLSAGAFARHGITLRREFGPAPPITVDKHQVLQILVNLVRNAKYACDESGKKDKVLTLRIDSDSQVVRIAVIDNGAGIAPENMSRLFTHGFTTRRSGHGFGLHSGAIAARELGGSLRAESAGPGHGATFTLELPRDQADQGPASS